MRNRNMVRDIVDRRGAAIVRKSSTGAALASMKLLTAPMLPTSRRRATRTQRISHGSSDVTELNLHVDGFSVLVRFFPDDVSMRRVAAAETRSLLLSAFEKVFDGIRGSSQLENPASGALPVVLKAVAAMPEAADRTVLRVGPLALDLLERRAKRGDRQIPLRPREFSLLRYMMERSDKLLTRARLLQEVWNYKFVPQTNLVDVHIGRLRRKVDGMNEPAMIRSVRGAGFVLSANTLDQN